MGKKAKLREVAIPAKALATGRALMEAQNTATVRYQDWAVDTVAAMNIGEPKGGNQWLVDPQNGKVREAPRR